MTPLAYASDEDVALLSPSDVGPLFPEGQVIASGSDGEFLPSDRWTLRSGSASFLTSGLQSGHVVRLIGPMGSFPPPGLLVGVGEVGEDSVTLRRPGMMAGLGAPIAPPGGLTGVSYVVKTLGPQLEQSSRELDFLLGIEATQAGSLLAQVPGGTVLRDAVVRLVLARRYAAIARDGDASFSGRARLFEASFERLMTRLFVSEHVHQSDHRVRFGTRLVR